MLNQVVLVGRVIDKTTEEIDDIKICTLKLNVPRNFKNDEGEYINDVITCTLYSHVAESTNKFCNIDDLVGIKGRIETKDEKMMIVAEKVTFLSSKKVNEEDE